MFASANISAYAGGPLWVENGAAITYGTNPVVVKFDKGILGKLSNDEAVQMFEEIFSEWENVPSATIKFEEADPNLIGEDVDGTNYQPYFLAAEPLGYTPVIFDNDGAITDKIYGGNASLQYLGFGGPVFANNSGRILESLLIINGKWYNNIQTDTDPERTFNSFKNTIAHELGHVIGLDHSSINDTALDLSSTQELKDSVPLMFPVGISEVPDLRQDDKSSVSLLYPKESKLANFGKIKGRVFREDSTTPILGANVIARNEDNPLLTAVSCISDYLADGTGSFLLTAVPPGKYTIEVEPINSLFSGNSTVGPHAGNLCDGSFLYPVTKGFYSSPNLPATIDKSYADIINVEAGKTINNVNIVAVTNAAASRHLQCNTQPPNFSGSSSSGNPNLLCCQGFVERQQDQICPSNYTITFCENLNLSGCCPNINGSSSSSSSSGSNSSSTSSSSSSSGSENGSSTSTGGSSIVTTRPVIPDCIWTQCGNNCCVSGCCKSNPEICSSSSECKKDQSTPTSLTDATSATNNNPEFSPPSTIEPPIFLTLPIDINSSGNNPPITSAPASFVEVSSVPNFPKLVELPLVTEEFAGSSAFAYPGSNPSIEIKLPTDQIKSTILYVHLKDSKGSIFQNIPFTITKISSAPDKIILSLQLPNQISTGKLKFTLFLHTGKLISGFINIIDYLNIQNTDTALTIDKPAITSITKSKTDQTISLLVKGKNFVGNKVQLTTSLNDTVSLKSLRGPQTSATIFPSNLNIQINKLSVTKNGSQAEIKLTIPEGLTGKTNAVLVITTPRGIISKSFTLK